MIHVQASIGLAFTQKSTDPIMVGLTRRISEAGHDSCAQSRARIAGPNAGIEGDLTRYQRAPGSNWQDARALNEEMYLSSIPSNSSFFRQLYVHNNLQL